MRLRRRISQHKQTTNTHRYYKTTNYYFQYVFNRYPHSLEESSLLVVSNTAELKVKRGSSAILVKNIYLSCDPYMGFS
ncbi:hypothetical protein YC2023_078059 [Brassica napus]